ncbi:MAG: hypothetical protein GWP06_04800 [Actinobacteria bacterium]|nr:hypothetical protein [Actinomycetota bacterium]
MHINKVVLVIVFLVTGLSYSQDLIWPTDASHAMTSSFAESRPGRFHAGLDIKTWGREGYKIFAIGSGYVSRIRVSPYGYGRAIYFTLDTGETVVYGHQKKFNRELEEYVRRQQEKRGVYSLQLYPPSTRFRYFQGDILGYTGQTGVGYPHLHFEIRDKSSRPINPFLRGYRVQDSVAPTITKVSVTPLDAYSTVDGDWRPGIFKVIPTGNHHYRLAKPVLACGRIAFGVSAFDRMDGVTNKFGSYKNELLIDDQVVFSAKYDRFSYAENNQATLDRDFRFYVQGKGLFYNLFRDIGNHLSFYPSAKKFYGVLNFGDFQCTNYPGNVGPQAAGVLTPYTDGIVSVSDSMHSFKIIVRDFWGNQSVVEGALLHDKRDTIKLDIDPETWTGHVLYDNGIDMKQCTISVSRDRGRTWHHFSTIKDSEPLLLTSTSENIAQDQDFSFELPSVVPGNELYLKAQAQDDNGDESFPAFAVVSDQSFQNVPLNPVFSIESKFYDHYVRLEFTSTKALFALPQIVGIHDNGKKETLRLIQKSTKKYYGSWPLKRDDLGPIPLSITTFSQNGKTTVQRRWLLFKTVRKGQKKAIRTNDGLCSIDFPPGSLFKNIFVRTSMDSEGLYEFPAYEIIGSIYSIEPKDVALNKGVTVSIKYPPNDPEPEKLAIYYLVKGNKWVFFGNDRNIGLNTISGHVSSFGTHCLIRDTVPPEIKYLYPAEGSRIANATPTLKAVFKDALSGIRGDENMKMILDGKKVIAEYDPEKLLLLYKVRNPLTKGQHVLALHVRDRCGNASQQTHSFWVN